MDGIHGTPYIAYMDPMGMVMKVEDTLWWTYKKQWNMAIEIVDFPMKNGGSFHCFLLVHQRVILKVHYADYVSKYTK